MRCRSCNKNLTDRESTRKYTSSGEFLDLCDRCFDPIKEEVEVIENPLLNDEIDDVDDKLAEKFLEKYERII